MDNDFDDQTFEFSVLDRHLARLVTAANTPADKSLDIAAAMVSAVTRQGHVCLDLKTVSGLRIPDPENGSLPYVCPDFNKWRRILGDSNGVGVPGERQPLILDDSGRLYLYRYWEYEHQLAGRIRKWTKEADLPVDPKRFKAACGRLFHAGEESAGNDPDGQRVACAVAALRRFCVISGGPGTGKTTTVVRLLALLAMMDDDPERPRIVMAAPTGKAASRLSEAVNRAREKLNCGTVQKQVIPDTASSVHRLLRPIRNTPYFRRHEQNPLSADVVVVDEASMVDLALMSKLVRAVSSDARLILLGDKDQLASVEAGAVLGDICGKTRPQFSKDFAAKIRFLTGQPVSEGKDVLPGLHNSIVTLTRNYRFPSDGGIARFSRAVNRGNTKKAIRILKTRADSRIHWEPFGEPIKMRSRLMSKIVKGYAAVVTSKDPIRALDRFSRFRVLCAVRKGPFGVSGVNRLAEYALARKGLIHPHRNHAPGWYHGRPVLVLQNDYHLGLFNGDTGIAMTDFDNPRKSPRVYFKTGDGGIVHFPPVLLPPHETAFAMTIHKSQGSEFDKALILLPDRDVAVLSRELIYTAVTRAGRQVEIRGPEKILTSAVKRRIRRRSGLHEMLWESQHAV